MEDIKLIARKRDSRGSSNARRLRNSGSLPGVVYGEGKEADVVEIDTHIFEQLLHHHTSETIITTIELEGEGEVQVLVKDVQRHPTTGDVMHVDLVKIVAGQVIHVDIMLNFVGEAAGVKEGGLLEQVMHSIPIECLPKDLVESIEVDVSEMGIGNTMCISDLNLSSAFTPLVEEDAIVVAVAEPRLEEAEEAAEEGLAEEGEGAEPEVISEKKEGETE
jgi:large subunit ribosomal protein L25